MGRIVCKSYYLNTSSVWITRISLGTTNVFKFQSQFFRFFFRKSYGIKLGLSIIQKIKHLFFGNNNIITFWKFPSRTGTDNSGIGMACARAPYDVWERMGLFHVTEGNVVDYNFVRKTINELHTMYNIKEIAADRWNATQLITDLEGDGFTVVPMGMGFKDMSPPMKELYKLILEGQFIHGGNPVLRWMAGNVVAEIDAAENIKPSKKKSTEKIDGIVAWIMALDRCIRHEMQGSVYDEPDHDLIVL